MPQKQKLPIYEKIVLIQSCLEERLSIGRASQLGGVDWVTIKEWIRQYETEGADAFLLREKNRVYSPEIKLAAVGAYLAGEGSL